MQPLLHNASCEFIKDMNNIASACLDKPFALPGKSITGAEQCFFIAIIALSSTSSVTLVEPPTSMASVPNLSSVLAVSSTDFRETFCGSGSIREKCSFRFESFFNSCFSILPVMKYIQKRKVLYHSQPTGTL